MRLLSIRYPMLARGLALVAIVVAMSGAAQLISRAATGGADSFDQRCVVWDRAAGAALAALITERHPTADQLLADAVFRLRRARKNCRHDLAGLARFDYEALSDGRYLRFR